MLVGKVDELDEARKERRYRGDIGFGVFDGRLEN